MKNISFSVSLILLLLGTFGVGVNAQQPVITIDQTRQYSDPIDYITVSTTWSTSSLILKGSALLPSFPSGGTFVFSGSPLNIAYQYLNPAGGEIIGTSVKGNIDSLPALFYPLTYWIKNTTIDYGSASMTIYFSFNTTTFPVEITEDSNGAYPNDWTTDNSTDSITVTFDYIESLGPGWTFNGWALVEVYPPCVINTINSTDVNVTFYADMFYNAFDYSILIDDVLIVTVNPDYYSTSLTYAFTDYIDGYVQLGINVSTSDKYFYENPNPPVLKSAVTYPTQGFLMIECDYCRNGKLTGSAISGDLELPIGGSLAYSEGFGLGYVQIQSRNTQSKISNKIFVTPTLVSLGVSTLDRNFQIQVGGYGLSPASNDFIFTLSFTIELSNGTVVVAPYQSALAADALWVHTIQAPYGVTSGKITAHAYGKTLPGFVQFTNPQPAIYSSSPVEYQDDGELTIYGDYFYSNNFGISVQFPSSSVPCTDIEILNSNTITCEIDTSNVSDNQMSVYPIRFSGGPFAQAVTYNTFTFALNDDCPKNCNKHGSCRGTMVCECDEGYDSHDCTVKVATNYDLDTPNINSVQSIFFGEGVSFTVEFLSIMEINTNSGQLVQNHLMKSLPLDVTGGSQIFSNLTNSGLGGYFSLNSNYYSAPNFPFLNFYGNDLPVSNSTFYYELAIYNANIQSTSHLEFILKIDASESYKTKQSNDQFIQLKSDVSYLELAVTNRFTDNFGNIQSDFVKADIMDSSRVDDLLGSSSSSSTYVSLQLPNTQSAKLGYTIRPIVAKPSNTWKILLGVLLPVCTLLVLGGVAFFIYKMNKANPSKNIPLQGSSSSVPLSTTTLHVN